MRNDLLRGFQAIPTVPVSVQDEMEQILGCDGITGRIQHYFVWVQHGWIQQDCHELTTLEAKWCKTAGLLRRASNFGLSRGGSFLQQT